jgi:hypothetical protein
MVGRKEEENVPPGADMARMGDERGSFSRVNQEAAEMEFGRSPGSRAKLSGASAAIFSIGVWVG